jgi:hypothetical protein
MHPGPSCYDVAGTLQIVFHESESLVITPTVVALSASLRIGLLSWKTISMVCLINVCLIKTPWLGSSFGAVLDYAINLLRSSTSPSTAVISRVHTTRFILPIVPQTRH